MSDLPFLILLLLAVAFLLRVDFIYYIAYVCLAVYGWSRWVVPRSLRQIRVTRDYRDHAFFGEQVPVTIHVENPARLPVPWLHLRESIPIALRSGDPLSQVIHLPGRGTVMLNYRVQALRRGYYRLGPLRLSLGDFFGFQQSAGVIAPTYLTVYPRLIPLVRLGLPSRLPFGTLPSRQQLFADPSRPMGIRDFRSGDSLRQINWKVSARQSGRPLQVKTFEPAISLETALLLNLNLDDYTHNRYDGPEWAIEVAASLAAHLVDRRQAVGLMTNGADPLQAGQRAYDDQSGRLQFRRGETDAVGPPATIPPRPGRSHLMKVLEVLARVEADNGVPFVPWAPTACLPLSWGVTVLTVVPQGTEAVCQMLHRLVRSGYNPVLVVVEPTVNFGLVRERARRLGFAAFAVTDERQLAGWTRGGRP